MSGDIEPFLHELAAAAGAAALPYFRARHAVDDKSGGGLFDPVTEADRAAEAALRALVEARFPSHGIIGEEFGVREGAGEHVWVFDPIDGTRAFIAGLPVWGTIIGLMTGGRPSHGLFAQPFIGERFWGDGRTAHYAGPAGDAALATRATGRLSEATLMTTTPKLFSGADADAYGRVEAAVRLARYGADGYAYCLLAAGHVDLVVESGLEPYDIVGLIPIIEGAGGIVTDWTGAPAHAGGRVLAAANERLHAAALERLAA